MDETEVVWIDSKTPKICATCVFIATLGDGESICLKQSSVKNPFIMHIDPYNNAKSCKLWQKGGELETEKPSPLGLTPEEIKALSKD